jgi:hypothetical protein
VAVDAARLSASTADASSPDVWKDRIRDARDAQRPFVPTWLLNLAFAAGQHWVGYDKTERRVRSLRDLDPGRYGGSKELYTADRITEYRMAQLGELESGDDRPELLVVQEGATAEAAAKQLNAAVAYAWEHEWNAQLALAQARLYTLDLGVSALRCRWDPTKGPKAGEVPMHPVTGEPVTHPAEYESLLNNGTLTDGSLPSFKQVQEGRTCWEAYSSFGILAPPGFNHEDAFPWEVLVRPVPVDALIDEYGAAAAGLQPDADIASAMGLSTSQAVQDLRSQGSGPRRLKNAVWFYTCFQRPNQRYPRGAVMHLASNNYTPLRFDDSFQYQSPNGEWCSGVTYLHWWRQADRFYSRAFTEPLRDPQRLINRRKTQKTEIIDRGMPKTFIRDGDMPETPTGAPMEVVTLAKAASEPHTVQGIDPGSWMSQDLAELAEDLSHASTLSAIRLGENPQGVETYSQLAQLNDNETSKRIVILNDHHRQIATLVEFGVYDIRRYWPQQKQILVAGDDNKIAAATFQKNTVPDFYMVSRATGAPAPRSQGAQLKMLDAIWAAAVQAWVAVNDGAAWVEWYASCLKAGTVLDLPGAKADTQKELAYFENELMKQDGEQPQVADYDIITVHLPVHREAMDEARAVDDMATLARLYRHINDHQEQAQQNQANAQQAATQAAAAAGLPTPGQPGSAVPAGSQNGNQNPAGAVDYMPPMARVPPPNRVGLEFGQLAGGMGAQ